MARPLASVALDAADSSYEDTLDECNGFDTTPTTVLDQARVVNRALVGVSTVGGVLHVAVAVRGTHKIPENVIQDIDFPPVEVKSRLQQAEHPLQGAHVHRGFQGALALLLNAGLTDVIEAQVSQAGGEVPILLVGHSLGGAMAQLLALELLVTTDWRVSLVTFGQPPAGSQELVDVLEVYVQRGRLRVWRYVNGFDPVPRALDIATTLVAGIAAGTASAGLDGTASVAIEAGKQLSEYRHFGPAITLDQALMTGMSSLLDVAGAAAEAIRRRAPTALQQAFQEVGSDVLRQHSLATYRENLDMSGDDLLAHARQAHRVILSMEQFAQRIGCVGAIHEQLTTRSKQPASTLSVNALEHESTLQMLTREFADLPGGTPGGLLGAVIPAASLAVSCVNLGVSCVIWSKVCKLQDAVTQVDRSVGKLHGAISHLHNEICEELANVQERLLERMDDIVRLLKLQQTEELYRKMDALSSALGLYSDGGVADSAYAPRHIELAHEAFGMFIRALKRVLEQEAGQPDRLQLVWLYLQALRAAQLGLCAQECRGGHLANVARKFYLDGPEGAHRWGLAPLAGLLRLRGCIDSDNADLLCAQLNCTFYQVGISPLLEEPRPLVTLPNMTMHEMRAEMTRLGLQHAHLDDAAASERLKQARGLLPMIGQEAADFQSWIAEQQYRLVRPGLVAWTVERVSGHPVVKNEVASRIWSVYTSLGHGLLGLATTAVLDALTEAGMCFANGNGVEMNARQAVELYSLAASQACPRARFYLGECYAHGTGVELDQGRAAELYTLAARQGHVLAQFSLGECYEAGKGVGRDDARAAALYLLAADQQLRSAQFRLGMCYASGTGVGKDCDRADRLFQQSADQGHAGAQRMLGVRCLLGTGEGKALAEGRLEQAARSGDLMALDLLRWLRTGLACDFTAPQRLLLTGRQDALDERAALGSTNILVIGPQGESSGRSTIVSAMFNKKLEKGARGQLEDVQISSGLDRAGRHLNIFDISSEVQPRSLLHILRKYPSLCIDRVVCVFCNRLARETCDDMQHLLTSLRFSEHSARFVFVQNKVPTSGTGSGTDAARQAKEHLVGTDAGNAAACSFPRLTADPLDETGVAMASLLWQAVLEPVDSGCELIRLRCSRG